MKHLLSAVLPVLLSALLLLLLVPGAAGAEQNGDAAPETAAEDNSRVFYEIFVGSFSDSNGDGTGDLRGILNRLDYLNDGDPASGKSLGVEGLWLTPVFPSPSYHKYDVTDYRAVDPAFGTMADLEELIAACHERGMKLILDLPLNHTGSGHRWYKNFLNAHLMHNPRNDYYDFYVWLTPGDSLPAGRHFMKPREDLLVEANFSDGMPELNFDNPAVREALLEVARFWLDKGVDGFRFDAAKYPYLGEHAKNVDFWTWYLGELRAIRPDIYTVGEVWDGEGITNLYAPALNCFDFAASQAGGIIAETAAAGDVNRFTASTAKYLDTLKGLNPDALCVYFIANHDTDRAAGYLSMSNGRMAMAASLYLLSPGTPFIYYGEEIGLRGARGGANTDANRRLAMLWGDGDTVQDPPGSTYDKQTPYSVKDLDAMPSGLLNHYRNVIRVRRSHPEISRGAYTALKFEDTKAGGFLCTWNGSTLCVLHNTTPRPVTLDLTKAGEQAGHAFTEITDILPAVKQEGPAAALEGNILTLEGQTTVVLK